MAMVDDRRIADILAAIEVELRSGRLDPSLLEALILQSCKGEISISALVDAKVIPLQN